MRRRRNDDDSDGPFDWRPVVPPELREHVRHFLDSLPRDLRGSMAGFTVRASDDVQTLARRLERLAQELERKRRVTAALTDLLNGYTKPGDEDDDDDGGADGG